MPSGSLSLVLKFRVTEVTEIHPDAAADFFFKPNAKMWTCSKQLNEVIRPKKMKTVKQTNVHFSFGKLDHILFKKNKQKTFELNIQFLLTNISTHKSILNSRKVWFTYTFLVRFSWLKNLRHIRVCGENWEFDLIWDVWRSWTSISVLAIYSGDSMPRKATSTEENTQQVL